MADIAQNVQVTQVTEMTEELFNACQHLVPQLTHNNPPPTREQLALLLESPTAYLFMAKTPDFENGIVGLATLVLYRVPTGVRAYIEDVVVDEKARGKRIGEALTRACLEKAEQAGAPQVMLTSNPGRSAANRLYQRMGFEERETNVYRYSFKRG
jgi:ribosomal protein S18 acetylase RimI-like enzyme